MSRRSDGYHEIASLFQAINYGDQLTLSLSQTDHFFCADPRVPSDLIFKAVELYRAKTGLRDRISIYLEKHIPLEAGMGGGSSNVATTLWGINALHGYPISEGELQAWSGEIGSDCPFFFSCGTAYCTGRGEKVKPLPPLEGLSPFSVLKPSEGLSTQAIYHALRLDQCSKEDPEELLEAFIKGKARWVNDLEEPAFRLLPKLKELKQEWLQGKEGMMTGSGTALFKMDPEGLYKAVYRPKGVWYRKGG